MILSQLSALALSLFAPATLKLTGTIETEFEEIWSVAISSDGKHVLASEFSGLRVYDLATKKELVHSERWTEPCALASNAPIAVAFGRAEIAALGFPGLKPSRSIPLKAMGMDQSAPTAIAVTRDGSGACIGDDEGRFAWIDLKTGKVRQLHRFKGGLVSVAISPDGRMAAASSSDSEVLVMKVGSGEVAARLNGLEEVVGTLTFSADGNSLIAGSDDGILRQFNAKDWSEVSRGRHQGIAFCAVALPGSSRVLVASAGESSENSRISLLSLPGFKTLAFADVKGGIWWLAVTPDARTLVACGESSKIRIFSVAD